MDNCHRGGTCREGGRAWVVRFTFKVQSIHSTTMLYCQPFTLEVVPLAAAARTTGYTLFAAVLKIIYVGVNTLAITKRAGDAAHPFALRRFLVFFAFCIG